MADPLGQEQGRMTEMTKEPTPESWRTLAREQGKIIERMAIGLRLVRDFLAKPEWGTIQYMEGSDVYGDLDRALITIATALGENTDAAT